MSKYISADEMLEYLDLMYEHQDDKDEPYNIGILGAINYIKHRAKTIDIVRCQDCKHWVYNFNGCKRNPCTEPWYATDGCTYGERREP